MFREQLGGVVAIAILHFRKAVFIVHFPTEAYFFFARDLASLLIRFL